MAQTRPALLRDRAPPDRPTLMVLGTPHFAGSNRDIVNTAVVDVLAPQRQQEIAELIEQLKGFRPTHIAVEWPRRNQAALDKRYADYKTEIYTLTRNEIDQLGLRLAAALGHEKVYAVDWNESGAGEERLYDWPAYAESHGQKELLAAIVDPKGIATPPLGTQSIRDWLIAENSLESLAASHRVYFDIARIGDDALQPGANWVGHWYGRNLRIFDNLIRLSDSSNARVLVVYGTGHGYLLRQFAIESGAFNVVPLSSALQRK